MKMAHCVTEREPSTRLLHSGCPHRMKKLKIETIRTIEHYKEHCDCTDIVIGQLMIFMTMLMIFMNMLMVDCYTVICKHATTFFG